MNPSALVRPMRPGNELRFRASRDVRLKDSVWIVKERDDNGEPGKVNISSATYELIKDYYDCSYRGKISAKNVGEIDMYFIEHEHTIPKTLLLNENQEISQ